MKDSYALVTGASSGIGLAVAQELARNKHNLILVARRKSKLDQLAQTLSKEGVKVEVITADLMKANGAEALFDQVESKGFVVDVLVNNAGRGNAGDFADQELQHMRGTLALNMDALTTLSRLFLTNMLKRGQGRILNIASVAGFMPGPGFAVYHATKAYVLSLSEALNAELKGTGVAVTASCPGPTESEFHEHADTMSMKGFDMLSMMSAEAVAREAYTAMKEGRPFYVHGSLNKVMTTSPKFIPRRWVTSVVRKLMKQSA